jgi:chemotaxis signal transduction protein
VKYLPFRIAGHDFVLDASYVRSIIPFEGALRHNVDVIDLRKRLGLSPIVNGRRPLLLIVDTDFCESGLAGFVVDYVSDVVTGSPKNCRGGKLHTRGRPRWLLDPDSMSIDRPSFLSPRIPAPVRASRPE